MEQALDIASTAALMGDPARARMLLSLMGGRVRPASELARLARVSPQTASSHLAKLQRGGLLAVERHGRYRYYRLAGPDVANVVESLQNLTAVPSDERSSSSDKPLLFARTCYDHLAGKVAVALADALLVGGLLELAADRYHVTSAGERAFTELDVDPRALNQQRRPLAKPCLDWTERRYHVAGALGAALTAQLLQRKWLVRLEGTRAVHLTPVGLVGLKEAFGVRL